MSDLASALHAQPELNPRCKSAIAEARARRESLYDLKGDR